MMVKLFLGFLDLFKWVFKLLRVDYPKLRNILQVKLLIDTRRTYHNINANPNSKKGLKTNAYAQLLGIHFLTGAFFLYFIIQTKILFIAVLMILSLIMMMTAMTLLSHFTPVLLDTSDNTILLPRPVDGRTVFVARSLHALFYLFSISGALAFGTLVAGTVKYGVLFGIGFLLSLALCNLFTYFLIYLLFLGLLNIASGEKFKEIVTFLEIALPLVFIIVYLLMGENTKLEEIVAVFSGLNDYLPPAWFAGLVDALTTGNYASPYLMYIILSITVPLVSLLVVVLFLAPSFNRKLAQMEITPAKKNPKADNPGVINFFASILGRSKTEKSAFRLVWKLTGREKRLKLNTYPLLGTSLMFIYIIAVGTYKSVDIALNTLPQTFRHIPILYVCSLMLLTAISQMAYSEKYKAAWLFRAVPVSSPGELLNGSLKAVIAKFCFPVLLVIPPILMIWGPNAIDDVVFAVLNILLLSISLGLVLSRGLPFAKNAETISMAGKLFPSLAVIFLYIGICILHYFLAPHLFAVAAGTIPLAAAVLYLFRKYKHTSWATILEESPL